MKKPKGPSQAKPSQAKPKPILLQIDSFPLVFKMLLLSCRWICRAAAADDGLSCFCSTQLTYLLTQRSIK
jgi:hypothetical protein